jgi:vacuolar-type H+-ATPase subunit D/Vma8
VTAINSLIEIVEVENKLLALRCALPTGSRQVNSLKELSTRIAEIAFNVEDVRNEQQ